MEKEDFDMRPLRGYVTTEYFSVHIDDVTLSGFIIETIIIIYTEHYE